MSKTKDKFIITAGKKCYEENEKHTVIERRGHWEGWPGCPTVTLESGEAIRHTGGQAGEFQAEGTRVRRSETETRFEWLE